MKTSKRKRSSKSAPVAQDVVIDAAAAEAVVAEPIAAANEPVVEASAATDVVDVIADSSAETVVAEGMVVAEAVAHEAAGEVVAEAVAHEAADKVVADIAVSESAASGQADPVVVLAANCSVKDAASLKTSLIAVAQQSTAVTLDASAVERVDTATMQLLCAFVRDRLSRNQGIVWRGQSQALHDAVRLLGVGALLGFNQATGVAA